MPCSYHSVAYTTLEYLMVPYTTFEYPRARHSARTVICGACSRECSSPRVRSRSRYACAEAHGSVSAAWNNHNMSRFSKKGRLFPKLAERCGLQTFAMNCIISIAFEKAAWRAGELQSSFAGKSRLRA